MSVPSDEPVAMVTAQHDDEDVHSMADILRRHRDEERQAAAIAKRGNTNTRKCGGAHYLHFFGYSW